MRHALFAFPLLAACVPAPDAPIAPAPIGPAGVPSAAPSGPVSILTAADAEAYVLDFAARRGCTVSLDALDAQRRADGLAPTEAQLAGPGGIALLQTAALVDAAPFALIDRGVLVPDAADPRIVTSRGPGCA
ncbi:hypothetical protein [Jannaschia sp. W003]|uniref:hypothetical protein n=1 Tax=Jannaschia sp. W003 TaxID=2867012 RepID=UPI0021A77769|nr:hypothetical protein [Jannaschia sp. W003]UWQ22829.1 hypothetical protein K3554_07345 [Jannaschia sp. W003]